ncbi:uncharacterized protein [Epargyreus clarus]|uniref:uncharacterized protein isoform X2 n=1 Tax=Epargyreus clarus TaxID=520877 RepID=UPI003C30AC7F
MVKTCCVKNCDIGPKGKVTCFRFPNSRLLKRQWIDAIGLTNKLTANSTICIKHFQEDDYDIVRGRPRLKARVIPSVFSETEEPQELPDAGDTSPRILDEETDTQTDGHLANNIQNKKDLQCTSDKDTHIDNKKNHEANEKHESDEKSENNHEGHEKCKEKSHERDEKVKDKSHEENEKCKDKPHEGNENEKQGSEMEIGDKQKQKKSRPNGILSKRKKRKNSEQCLESIPKPEPANINDDLNAKDIEDILINYQIKQTRPVHSLDTEDKSTEQQRTEENGEKDGEVKENDPVFIEVSVQGRGDRAGSPRDCLMVLESVEVELDPSTFLTADGEHPDADCHETVDLDDDNDEDDRKQDPISLLTSSDEDDVIIQEPHIDTVEVSDETDEDDLPLVKLIKRSKKKKLFDNYEFFCVDCQYSTTNKHEYKQHSAKHSTIIQVCQVCDYTSASKTQFARHKRKHKEERRYRCHLCDYKARHNMSLIYHLKSHRALNISKRGYKCDKCGYKSDIKSAVLKHVKLCSPNVKWFSCDQCDYESRRQSDLRRHKSTRHEEDSGEEFRP